MNITSPALRRCLLTAALCTPFGLNVSAQGYGQPYGPAPYAPPSSGLRPIDQSPRVQDLPVYRPNIWQGLYIGGHIGGERGRGGPTDYSGYDIDMRGVSGGLHIGHNWLNERFVAGFEIDAAAKSTDGSRSFAGPVRGDLSQDWMTSFRMRLGYTLGDAMIYATGGYAVGHIDATLSVPGATAKASETVQGYVLGGGLELKFAPNVSGRLEGLHYGFTEKSYNFPGGSVRSDGQLSTVRAGISYHFN